MKLSEIKQLLAEHGVQLTKSLGQNFLHDANQLRRIAAAAELTPADKVLEIGPGLGALTSLLVQQAGEVLAIEKDARLLRLLEQRFAGRRGENAQHQEPEGQVSLVSQARLHLVHSDALDYLRREQRDWHGWKMVSNLPYSVASPILVELAQAETGPQCLVATVQLEVGRRLLAKPGDADYGLLTLLLQMNYRPLTSFKIPATCFFPAPEIDSACVTLLRRQCQAVPPARRQCFVKLVKRSFSQRRKMMLKLLKADWRIEQLDPAFRAAGLPPNIRAESVALEQFAELARHLPDQSQ